MGGIGNMTVLCRVVDNYGDIGFVYRLLRCVRELAPALPLRLVVDDLAAFHFIEPGVDPSRSVQTLSLCQTVPSRVGTRHAEPTQAPPDGLPCTVFRWGADELCREAFERDLPDVIVECFECGRPGWLDDLLFCDGGMRFAARPVRIFSVEYLTAEPWADEFHLLASATRSRFVKKTNVMPGFSSRTGGLLLDGDFVRSLDKSVALTVLEGVLDPQDVAALRSGDQLCVLFFSYARNFMPVVQALRGVSQGRAVRVFSATPAFSDFCAEIGVPFAVVRLDPLPQRQWDALLCACDFLFVRGEDSFSRACLSGRPFVWAAYVQQEEYQLVKVSALLDRLCQFACEQHRALLCRAFVSYNRTPGAAVCDEAVDVIAACQAVRYEDSAPLLIAMLNAAPALEPNFAAFAKALRANGNFAATLLRAAGG